MRPHDNQIGVILFGSPQHNLGRLTFFYQYIADLQAALLIGAALLGTEPFDPLAKLLFCLLPRLTMDFVGLLMRNVQLYQALGK